MLDLGNRHSRCDMYCPTCTLSVALTCSQMLQTYGPQWRTPNTSYHGDSAFTWDEPMLRKALLQKLSLTAWGDVPLEQRLKRCYGRQGTDALGTNKQV